MTHEINVTEICTQAFMTLSSWGATNPFRLNVRKDGRGSTGSETCLLRDHSGGGRRRKERGERGGGGGVRALLSPPSLLLLH